MTKLALLSSFAGADAVCQEILHGETILATPVFGSPEILNTSLTIQEQSFKNYLLVPMFSFFSWYQHRCAQIHLSQLHLIQIPVLSRTYAAGKLHFNTKITIQSIWSWQLKPSKRIPSLKSTILIQVLPVWLAFRVSGIFNYIESLKGQ